MTAINTNTAALNAQFYMGQSNKAMETAMTRLSSGKQVNSAADDAAGLAISSRMTSQLKGLSMAIKNAGDTISLAQTAEGALEEVTNMLQRIRELAVQSANGTMSASDRASLDAEVQALKTEIDRVAETTSFNNRALLDGSFSANFQIGHEAGQTVGLKIGSIETSALGMGGSSSSANSVVSSRVAIAAVDAGDIKINGQDLGAITTSHDMEDLLNNINTNVDNVTATGFNVIVAATKGNGVTGGTGVDGASGTTSGSAGLTITVRELGQTADTTFTISASSSMDELVANINAETGGVVQASTNEDGKLVLANNTGATITVEDDSASTGSGFSDTNVSYAGFIRLEADDDNPIRIETGNGGLSTPGSLDDLQVLGFRETVKDTSADGYTVLGHALTATGIATAWAKGDLSINGVEMYDENITTTSLAGKLELVNSLSDQTGVTASAHFSKTFAIDTDNLVENDVVTINGTDIIVGDTGVKTIAQFVTNINAQTAKTGLVASADGNNITFTGENVQAMTVAYQATGDISLSSTVSDESATNTDDRTITIAAGDVVEGRVFQIHIDVDDLALGGTANSKGIVDTTVTYTVKSGDGVGEVAEGLADALRNSATVFVDAEADSLDARTTAGSIVFDGTGLELGSTEILLTVASVATPLGAASTHYAGIKLDSVNNSPIKIDLGQNTSAANHEANHGFLESNVGAADFDVNEPTLSASGGSSVSGLSVATAAGAEAALGTLDNAINSVNAIRGNLGAIQNRLDYTINNLSSISNATEGARGRIVDADYAKETSALTKQQILAQAATSMLAQANQTKQSVLALLQS
jgi:flagellin